MKYFIRKFTDGRYVIDNIGTVNGHPLSEYDAQMLCDALNEIEVLQNEVNQLKTRLANYGEMIKEIDA